MSFLSLFCQNSFVAYNKAIARHISVQSAILFGSLCSFHNLFCDEDEEEFFINQEIISEDTSLSLRAIRQATQELVSYGFITVTRKGVPAKNYYKINSKIVMHFMEEYGTTGSIKSVISSSSKSVISSSSKSDSTINNNIINNNINKNISLNKESESNFYNEPNLYFINIREHYNAYGREEHEKVGFIEYKTLLGRKELPQHSSLLSHIKQCGESLQSWQQGYAPSLKKYLETRMFETPVEELIKMEQANNRKKINKEISTNITSTFEHNKNVSLKILEELEKEKNGQNNKTKDIDDGFFSIS